MATHHSFSATLRLPAGSGSLSQPITAAPATAGGTQSLAPSTPDSPKLTQELMQRLEQLESENERMKHGKYSASWGAGLRCVARVASAMHTRGGPASSLMGPLPGCRAYQTLPGAGCFPALLPKLRLHRCSTGPRRRQGPGCSGLPRALRHLRL